MYATAADITDLHGADFALVVAARGGEASLADPLTAAAMADALAQASSEIDGYLSVRYPTPVTPAPAILVNHAVNIAVYQLASTADRMTDIIRERYKQALAWLKDISQGRANLPPRPDGSGGTTPQGAPELGQIVSQDPVFQRGRW